MVYFFFSESYRYGNYRVGMIWVTITLKYLYIRSSQVTVSFLFYWIIVNLQPGISFNCKSDSYICIYQFSSVQFSRSVVSDSLQPHELQHTKPPCPSPTPGVYPNSCPSSRWCHPAISSSVVPFSSCPQSLPASGCFPMSQLFAWGGQSIGVSASASVWHKWI